jgi:hypothetical protein
VDAGISLVVRTTIAITTIFAVDKVLRSQLNLGPSILTSNGDAIVQSRCSTVSPAAATIVLGGKYKRPRSAKIASGGDEKVKNEKKKAKNFSSPIWASIVVLKQLKCVTEINVSRGCVGYGSKSNS